MYSKYRIFLNTTRGGYFMAAADSVNGLRQQCAAWFENTSAGRSIYDDMIRGVVLYEFDPDTGAYKFSEQSPADSIKRALAAVHDLGGR